MISVMVDPTVKYPSLRFVVLTGGTLRGDKIFS